MDSYEQNSWKLEDDWLQDMQQEEQMTDSELDAVWGEVA